MSEGTIRTDRTASSPRLRYYRAGERGAKVLMVMGFGMRGAIWKPQIDGLRDDHQLAFFDNRGVGQSERGPARTWTMADMARNTRG